MTNKHLKAYNDFVDALGLAATSARKVKRLNHEIVECLVNGRCHKELLKARQKEVATHDLLHDDLEVKRELKKNMGE